MPGLSASLRSCPSLNLPSRIWTAAQASFQGDPTGLYGPELARCLGGEPDSAFVAEGSAVTVYSGNRIG